jgi:mono/diheme cytochrome c family protein
MNKEVNYVLQGFLLTLVVIGTLKFGGFLLSIPPPPAAPEYEWGCGTVEPTPPPLTAPAIQGKAIFQDNCASCHSLLKDLTGPALAGVKERVPDKKLLYKWIRNPSAVLRSGNKYFNALKKQFGNVEMTGFPNLTDEEINLVLAYIDAYSSHSGY